MTELWRPILGFEEYYMVSNMGNVKRLPRNTTRIDGVVLFYKEKLLKPYNTKHGYLHIDFYLKRKRFTKKVHRISCEAFIGKSEMEVNHKNGDKKDNRLSNLEYLSSLDNCNHRERVLNKRKRYGVTFDKSRGKWVARIKITVNKCDYKNLFLGRFQGKDQAHSAFYNKYTELYKKSPW